MSPFALFTTIFVLALSGAGCASPQDEDEDVSVSNASTLGAMPWDTWRTKQELGATKIEREVKTGFQAWGRTKVEIWVHHCPNRVAFPWECRHGYVSGSMDETSRSFTAEGCTFSLNPSERDEILSVSQSGTDCFPARLDSAERISATATRYVADSVAWSAYLKGNY